MDFEERARRKRRQFIKVLIAELGMAIAVILIVIVAVMAAMGFFVSSDGTIEQSGLIQIHSLPTGATVELDGTTVFSRTNLSKTLPAGSHEIKIHRDGYDTWQKRIEMYSGMLIRLYYPRLFLENRSTETVFGLGSDLEFYTPSTDYTYILYAAQDSARWQLVNIKGDEIQRTDLDLTKVLPGVSEEGMFLGKILDVKWNETSDQVLTKVSYENNTEWILVNLKDVTRSLNLTKTFGMSFEQVEMVDSNASQLFALDDGQLRKINTVEQAISRVLLEKVQSFANNGANLIYVATTETNEKKPVKNIGVYRDGDKDSTILKIVEASDVVRVALAKFYGEDYLAWTVNNKMSVYYGAIPAYNPNSAETDFSGLKDLVNELDLAAVPESLTVSPDSDYLIAQKGQQYMVLDFEVGNLSEYEASVATWWLDDNMKMAVVDGKLEVWDFDHMNQRTLVAPEKPEMDFAAVTTRINHAVANCPAVIANNNKWLYYVVQTGQSKLLQRERIRD